MYAFLVGFHNIIRWLVVLLGLISVIKAVSGWLGKKEWTENERKIGVFFSISVDIQILIGLLLYFIYSDWGLKAFIEKSLSEIMGNSAYRFFAVEHVFYMMLGLVFAHLGTSLPKKAKDNTTKFKRAAIFFVLALFVIMAGIPWGSRSLFPGLM